MPADGGAVMNDISAGGGRWSVTEADNHINCLERLAVLYLHLGVFMPRFLENMLS